MFLDPAAAPKVRTWLLVSWCDDRHSFQIMSYDEGFRLFQVFVRRENSSNAKKISSNACTKISQKDSVVYRFNHPVGNSNMVGHF
jgi:hypothetical protein